MYSTHPSSAWLSSDDNSLPQVHAHKDVVGLTKLHMLSDKISHVPHTYERLLCT